MRLTIAHKILAVVALTSVMAGCSSPSAKLTKVVLVTHDSFAVPDKLIKQFEADTGYQLEVVAPGDAGTLVNQLILTKDAPLGDVVYGIDNTFASRALAEGVIDTNAGKRADWAIDPALPTGTGLVPVDYSDVCINADLTYFTAHHLALPSTLEDLTKPEYKGLLSVSNPTTSSPGLAFLLATYSAFGDQWRGYWAALRKNGLRVTASWSDTYYTDFSAPAYGGAYPLVLSYASSPPFEVVNGQPTTTALLNTCFRQTEYVGVLAGAHNPDGARAVVEWMQSKAFQEALPENMYVYPASPNATVPADWKALAPLSPAPRKVDSAVIDKEREMLLTQWTETVLD